MDRDRPDPVGMLLLRIATGGGAALDGELARLDDAGWQTLAECAILARLGPFAAQVLAQRECATPQVALALLNSDQREHALRALSQRHTIARIARQTDDLGLNHVVLKGWALVLGQAGEPPVTRIMRDLDILLPPADVRRLHACLLDQGWTVPPGFARQERVDDHHLPVLADPENGNLVELHLRLVKQDWAGDAALQGWMFDSPVGVSCLGQQVQIPHPSANFLHLLAHATLNRPFDPGPQFLADAAGLICGGTIDPGELAVQAQVLGLDRALALTLCLIDRLGALSDGAWRALITPQACSQADAAIVALLAPQGRDREWRFGKEIRESGSTARWLLASISRALNPGAEALAAIAGRKPEDPLRYLAYPRWIGQRTRTLARAILDPAMQRDMRRSEELRNWLTAGAMDNASAHRSVQARRAGE